MLDPAYRLLGVTYYVGQSRLKAHVLVVAKQAVAQVEIVWHDREGSTVPPATWAEQAIAEVRNREASAVSDPFARFLR